MPKRRTRPWQNREALFAVLQLSISINFVATMVALLSIARGLRVRGWNKLCTLATQHPSYYSAWIRSAEYQCIAKHMRTAHHKTSRPSFACIVFEDAQSEDSIITTIDSLKLAFGENTPIWTVRHKSEPGHERTLRDHHLLTDALETIATDTNGCWLLMVKAGDTFSAELGAALAVEIENNPDSTIIYWDEDVLAAGKRQQPWIKPDWDELLFLAKDYLSGSCAIRCDVAIGIAKTMTPARVESASIAKLFLFMTLSRAPSAPHHMPLIMSHRASTDGFVSSQDRAKLISSIWYPPVRATSIRDTFLEIAPVEPSEWPSVTIIIPTRDHADILATCIRSLEKLQYIGETEIIIIDNGSEAHDALKLLYELEGKAAVRVIRAPGKFNFSTLNNLAAREARGTYLCLLNNDIEALDGNWLSAMIAHALLPDVGAVGAQLLYPDGSIQHAGVAIGVGNAAGHIQKGIDPTAIEHVAWHGVTRTVSAVTAACMVLKRDHYMAAGGLDEVAFPVAFNDVDLCLKLKAKGLRNIYVAEARLIHHESRSRGNDYAPEHNSRFQRELDQLHRKWQTVGYIDPCYSPLFSRTSEQCVLEF